MKLSVFFPAIVLMLCSCQANNSIPTPTITSLPASTATKPASTATPTLTATTTPEPLRFSIDKLNLQSDIALAIKKHVGLEDSIRLEADGRFVVSALIFNSLGEAEAQDLDAILSTLTQNTEVKNIYGDTPIMQTSDGKTLYWIPEYTAWFDVTNIQEQLIPLEKSVLITRDLIVKNPDDFSQEALDFWHNAAGLQVGYLDLQTTSKSGEVQNFTFIRNGAMADNNQTINNSPEQILPQRYRLIMPSGKTFSVFGSKWLDPKTPQNPKGTDWDIILSAIGMEIADNADANEKFENLLEDATASNSKLELHPIVRATNDFFTSTWTLYTLVVPQPSLAELVNITDERFSQLEVPNRPGDTFDKWIDLMSDQASPTNPSITFAFATKDDPSYHNNFFPDEIQTIVFPTLVVVR